MTLLCDTWPVWARRGTLLRTGAAGGTAVGGIDGTVRGGLDGGPVVVVVEGGVVVVVVVGATVVVVGATLVAVLGEGGTVGAVPGVGGVVVVVGDAVVVVVGVVVVEVVVDAGGTIDAVGGPVVVGSDAEGSSGVGPEAFATPAAVSAKPARVPTDRGITSMVVSRRWRRCWDTGTSPDGEAERASRADRIG